VGPDKYGGRSTCVRRLDFCENMPPDQRVRVPKGLCHDTAPRGRGLLILPAASFLRTSRRLKCTGMSRSHSNKPTTVFTERPFL
jgi:hypothetical protein